MKVSAVYSLVAVGDHVFEGGENDLEVTAEIAPLVAGAVSAGSLVVVEATDAELALLEGHVQSQEDGEAEYEKAVGDGRWHEGQAIQAAAEEADREAAAKIEIEADDVASVEEVLGS